MNMVHQDSGNTVSRQVVYEHPLNERIRTFLRLEHLFSRIGFFLPQDAEWATRMAVGGLLDILSMTARADIKTEILKELDRHSTVLGRISRQPGVDMQTLGKVQEDIEQAAGKVYRLGGQIGQHLRESEFIKTIMQRSSIPGGTLSFDIPQYHHWLLQGHAARERQMQDWLEPLVPIRDAVTLLLSLARGSSTPRTAIAPQGFFQDTLDAQAPVQMVRVVLDPGIPVFPEVSGHKHRFSIRFMEAVNAERPTQTERDVEFQLTTCVF